MGRRWFASTVYNKLMQESAEQIGDRDRPLAGTGTQRMLTLETELAPRLLEGPAEDSLWVSLAHLYGGWLSFVLAPSAVVG